MEFAHRTGSAKFLSLSSSPHSGASLSDICPHSGDRSILKEACSFLLCDSLEIGMSFERKCHQSKNAAAQ
jgi:hypothetical protein